MSNTAVIVFIAFLVFWFYCIFSVYSSEFKEEKAKVFWRIGIVFVPFLALFYIFLKKNLLK